MKKIMFTIAAILAASVVQAASVSWTLSAKNSVMLPGGAAAEGTTVFLVNASATTYSTLTSGLADGSVTAANIASQGAYLGSGKTGTGKSAGKIATTATANDSLTAGQNYNLAYVVFSGDQYYLSGAKAASAWDGETYLESLAQKASWDATAYSADNWKTPSGSSGDVPEPTSSLLLLMGGAMLALRRKQK